jgi:hypothetical protein
MGIKPAPSYANIFMAKIDELANKLARKFGDGTHPVKAWKRVLDDIYILWIGSCEKLQKIMDNLNLLHPSIKFTMSHTTPREDPHPCHCTPTDNLAFLDTSTSIVDNNILVDLYKKDVSITV